ncbi:hypothetical protein CKO51_25470 [Rhodopirellula sp. SM50]|nr:hypothetical protein CKO51_25470 [Rhodopirellula sp. SM50]
MAQAFTPLRIRKGGGGGGDDFFRTCQREVFEAEPAMAASAPSEGPVVCLVGMAGIAWDSSRFTRSGALLTGARIGR